MTLKQSTLNDHVNIEAVRAYVDRLYRQAEQLRDHAWLEDEPNPDVETAKVVERAAEAMTKAIDQARDAERQASGRFYAHIYMLDAERKP